MINDLKNADKHMAELEQALNAEKSPQAIDLLFKDAIKQLCALHASDDTI